jgi:hypothetical protein
MFVTWVFDSLESKNSWGEEWRFHIQVVDIGPLAKLGLKLPICEDQDLELNFLYTFYFDT